MKITKWVILAVLSASTVMSLSLMACNDEKQNQGGGGNGNTEVPAEGPEAGVYYYTAADNSEYLITLNGATQFSLYMDGENKSGSYSLADNAITFDFAKDEDGTASATLTDGVLVLTYNGGEWRFLKKIQYTVMFDEAGGSEVADVTVVNGKTISRPADPVREGYQFIGWYTDDAMEDFFAFDSEAVTSDMTLHAYWAAEVPGLSEYTIDFDAGDYDGQAPESMTTVGGKLYNVPEMTRDGYTFAGWWISMYDDGEKLSYRYTEDMTFTENTTLFAMWTQSSSDLAAPMVSVSDTRVDWDVVPGATTYKVRVYNDKTTVEDTSVGTPGVSVSFASCEAGDYIVEVTAEGANDQSVTTTRYYKNKALARVSSFSVLEPSLLVFEGVENAVSYRITVDCGDDRHMHTDYNLGKATSFNFENCPMTAEGISFTVTASAPGYADSVSRTFVYNRVLDAVTGLTVDDATQTLVWDSVEGATNYKVSVNGVVTDNGASNSFSLKTFDPGELEITVTPATVGYNSPAPSEITYTKTTLATPDNIRIADTTLMWDSVENATGYEVRIGASNFTVEGGSTTSLDIAELIEWTDAEDYVLSIRAVGATNSLWSDGLDIRYNAMYATLNYYAGEVSWRPVVGAEYYQVSVNDGEAITVSDGAASAPVELTRGGYNTIAVRFFDGIRYSDWAEKDVYAYTISFDSRGGAGVVEQYKAMGDYLALPATSLSGFVFDSWYSVPNGPEGNGKRYADGTFTQMCDVVLYAYYTPSTYTLTLVSDDENLTADVVYGQKFSLPVPENAPGTDVAFAGWYSEPNGSGIRYTDSNGASVADWNVPSGVTLYAYWADLLAYTLENDGSYAVSAGDGIRYITEVTIPAEHNGEPVSIVDAYAFRNLSNLEVINIPDTISIIYTENAFSGCTALRAVNIYDAGGAEDIYVSDDGVLYFHNYVETSQPFEVAFVPEAKTGVYRIMDGVTTIPRSAFADSSLTEITVPSSVTFIGRFAFSRCDNLREVIFESAADAPALEIESMAINSCTGITDITIPARAENWAIDVITSCTSLQNINVEQGNEQYSSVNGVLCNKAGDTIVLFPAGRTGAYTIPAGISSIGANAFEDCALTEIVIPSYVTSIGEEAFRSCSDLIKVTFGGQAITGCTVGEGAFRECSNLTTVVFEEGSMVLSLGEDAFYSCRDLESFTLPASVTSVGASAFSNCTSLKSFTIAEGGSEVSFGSSAFSNCTSLTEFYIPASVTEISTSVFSGCDSLAAVYVDENNPNYTDIDGVLFNKDVTEILFYSFGMPSEYVLPETVTTIGKSVFEGNENLKSITIGKNVTSIDTEAFMGCVNLEEVIFEAGGTGDITFGSNVFADCIALTSVALPERVTSTGYAMFTRCYGLESVVLPAGFTTFGSTTFNYCISLATVSIAGQQAVEGTAVIPSGVKEISSSAFQKTAIRHVVLPNGLETISSNAFNNSALEEITLPETLTTIGGVYALGNLDITELYIPSSVTTISSYAFGNNRKLRTVTFGAGVSITSIEADTFLNCTSLTSLVLPETVTEISSAAFDGSGLKEIYIPAATEDISSSAFSDCLSLATITVAAENKNYMSLDGVLYEKDENGNPVTLMLCPVANTGKNGTFELVIPETVTLVNNSAFNGNLNITKVEFTSTQPLTISSSSSPSATTSAFAYAEALRTVVLPEGMTELRNYTFAYCDALESIVIPASVEEIGNYAFAYCSNLKSVTFAENSKLTSFGTYVFRGNSSLQSIDIPVGVEEIGTGVFWDCSSLETVSIPANLTTINNQAFRGCNSLVEFIVDPANTAFYVSNGTLYEAGGSIYVHAIGRDESVAVIPEGTTSIGAYAFYGRTDIESIVIPASVTSIGDYAFYNCTNLKTVVFANGGESLSIGGRAFYGCSALTSITLPKRVNSIGTYIFYNCTSLEEVVFEKDIAISLIPSSAFQGCTSLDSIVIPKSVIELGGSAFRASGISSITFEDGSLLNKIGSSAFRECASLTSIAIPAGVTALSSTYTFGDCTNLKTVTHSLTTLPANSFVNCTSLTDFDFSTVTSIAGTAFQNCTSLTSADLTFATSVGASAFAGCTSLVSVVWPTRVDVINKGVFSGCTSLSSVSLGTAVTEIGESAFSDCTSLTAIDLPSGLQEIGNYAFSGCVNLASVNVPSTVTSLGSNIFRNCPLIENFPISSSGSSGYVVQDGILFSEDMSTLIAYPAGKGGDYVVPDYVTTIGAGAFAGSAVTSVTLHSGITSIPSYAFSGCKQLTTLVLPDSITSIGTYAFEYSGIKSLVLPDGITTVNSYLFRGSAIESVTIPGSVTSIATYAFEGCASLTEVIFLEGTARMSFGNYAFANCTALRTITIPDRVRSSEGRTGAITDGIGDYCFAGCTSLETVLFGEERAITLDSSEYYLTLGDYAFSGCTSLVEIAFPDHIGKNTSSGEAIGNYCFAGCTSLVSISFENTCEEFTLDSYVFSGCTSLESVILPSNTVSIDVGAFSGCTKLSEIVIPATVESIGENAFEGWTAEQKIIVPFAEGATPEEWEEGWQGDATVVYSAAAESQPEEPSSDEDGNE